MENIAVNMASDLSQPVRAAIEDMLGRTLRDDEQVSVMAFGAHAAPTGAARAESAQRLKAAMDALAVKALPRALIELIRDSSDHSLILSPFLLTELDRVLNYPRLQAIWPLTQLEIASYIQALQDFGECVFPGAAPNVVAADPADDAVRDSNCRQGRCALHARPPLRPNGGS